MKFTFKTIKPTGKWGYFSSDEVLIKLDKKEVGCIEPSLPFKIKLMILKSDINEDGNPNCKWKWITLKKRSETLNKAKQFLKDNTNKIIEKYDLYCIDPN